MEHATIKLLARIAFWLALITAYVLALLPGDPHVFRYDKGNHLLAFAVLAVLGRLGFGRGRSIWITIGLIAFGGLIELSQALPAIHRDASWADLAADAIATLGGLIAGSALAAVFRAGRRASPF